MSAGLYRHSFAILVISKIGLFRKLFTDNIILLLWKALSELKDGFLKLSLFNGTVYYCYNIIIIIQSCLIWYSGETRFPVVGKSVRGLQWRISYFFNFCE